MNEKRTFVNIPLGFVCVPLNEYESMVSDFASTSADFAHMVDKKDRLEKDLAAARAELDNYRRFFAQDIYSKGKYEDFIHYGSKPIDPVEKEGF